MSDDYLDIPFNDWSTAHHLADEKTATTRTSRYGDPGDRFTDAGFVFELTHVVKVPLHVVAVHFYEAEGAESFDEFVEVWKDIHYRRGFDDDWPVYLHLYRKVGEVEAPNPVATAIDDAFAGEAER